MAALDQVTSSGPVAIDVARTLFAATIWKWYRAHRDDVFYTHKFFAWFSVSITVEKARPLIELIAGPETPI